MTVQEPEWSRDLAEAEAYETRLAAGRKEWSRRLLAGEKVRMPWDNRAVVSFAMGVDHGGEVKHGTPFLVVDNVHGATPVCADMLGNPLPGGAEVPPGSVMFFCLDGGGVR